MSVVALATEVLIPREDERLLMRLNQIVERPHLGRPETARLGEGDRHQPELGQTLRFLDVDVAGLIALPAEEKESISLEPHHLWHHRSRESPPRSPPQGSAAPRFGGTAPSAEESPPDDGHKTLKERKPRTGLITASIDAADACQRAIPNEGSNPHTAQPSVWCSWGASPRSARDERRGLPVAGCAEGCRAAKGWDFERATCNRLTPSGLLLTATLTLHLPLHLFPTSFPSVASAKRRRAAPLRAALVFAPTR